MYKKRKLHNYPISYVKPPTSMKINKIIKQAIPVTPDTPDTPTKPSNSGLSDSEGLKRAYQADNAIFIDGNKAYVAGTRSAGEAYRDWGKIARWDTTHVERYGQLTEALKGNPQVDTLIGHSLGASTVAELQRQTNNRYMARYYGAPFLNLMPWDTPDPKNQTFRHPNDPFSMFDRKANTLHPYDFWSAIWPHSYSGFDPSEIPESYSNDFDETHPSMKPN